MSTETDAVRGRVRRHAGTLADACGMDQTSLILRVIGERPLHQPYLSIYEVGDGPVYATVTNPNALRGLAHAILRALGDERPTPTAKPRSES